ncbi:MAG: hypothetical protein Q7S32_04115 [bacterium]|nr:hypothetical protein [bacterium]
MKKIKIIVIDDKQEELERAKAAVEAAGHEAIAFSDFSYRGDVPSVWKQMAEADGVITDLFFDPRCNTNNDVREAYKANPPAMGLVVALHAFHLGKPVVICTSGYHHGPELSFVYDAYCSATEFDIGFGWEEGKDWAKAVKMLETGVKNPWALDRE